MKENTKNILLGVLIVGLVAMTVAFAALSTTLRIGGTANVAEAKWDIHFENWTEAKPATRADGTTNTASQSTAATMAPSTKGTLISGLVVELPRPGDTTSYTFDIVNDGTINAKLSDFEQTISAKVAPANTETADTNDLTYTIQCGAQATKGSQTFTATDITEGTDLLDAGNARACKLTITYNEATNSNSGTPGEAQIYTGTARTVTLGADWVWVQN